MIHIFFMSNFTQSETQGTRGNCSRCIASCGYCLALSKNQVLFTFVIGYIPGSGVPSMCHVEFSNFTYTTSGSSSRILTPSSHMLVSVGCSFQEWILPILPRSNCLLVDLSMWSVNETGKPSISGNIPYKSPHSRSCLLSHDFFCNTRSGRSCKVFGSGLSLACAHVIPNLCVAA